MRRIKTKMLRFLLLISCLFLVPCHGLYAQHAPADREAVAMLKEFYAAYITAFSALPTADALKKLHALPKRYCTATLLRKINRQGYLDADPFTQSQDVDLSWRNTLVVRKEAGNANFYTVTLGDDVSRFKVAIHVTVLQQGTGFRLAAIRSFKYQQF
jgi:hypothetical protein